MSAFQSLSGVKWTWLGRVENDGPDPEADNGRIEIPRGSILLPAACGILPGLTDRRDVGCTTEGTPMLNQEATQLHQDRRRSSGRAAVAQGADTGGMEHPHENKEKSTCVSGADIFSAAEFVAGRTPCE